MGRPTPETGGGTPQNHGLSEFKPLAQERRVGWGVKKPEERPLLSKSSEQKGEAKPLQPYPAEQQATERLGKPPPERPQQGYASGTLQGFGLGTFMTNEEVELYFNPSEQKETKKESQ